MLPWRTTIPIDLDTTFVTAREKGFRLLIWQVLNGGLLLLVVWEGVDREMVGLVGRGFKARERSGKVRRE